MNGEKLKQLRLKHHISIKDISEILNVSERTYQSYERNERDPSTKTLAKISAYFGVSADYLIDADLNRSDRNGVITDHNTSPTYGYDPKLYKAWADMISESGENESDGPKIIAVNDKVGKEIIIALDKCTTALKRIQPEEGASSKKENRLLAAFKKLSEKQQDSVITNAELLAENNK